MFYKSIPRLIYHYTNVDTLVKIIENQELWLFSCLGMNDLYDTVWYEKTVVNWLKQKNKTEDCFGTDIITSICEAALTKVYLERRWPFAICFCSQGDLLSQWRAYGKDGKGVSIGFDPFILGANMMPIDEAVSLGDKDTGDGSFFLIDLLYSMKSINTITERCFHWIFDPLLEKIRKEKDMDNFVEKFGDEIWGMAIIFASFIQRAGLFIKNTCFKEEKEWRLMSFPDSYFSNQKAVPKNDSINSITINDKTTKYYISYNFEDMQCEGLIKEIILGPKFDGNRSMLKSLLSIGALQAIKIRDSKIPYI